jgi:hypothetical protein
MPVLAWRNDADGFAFQNNWTFDAAERAALTALAQPLVPAVLGAISPLLLIPDPILWAAVTTAAFAAAQYPAVGPLPSYGMCGGMAYASLDHWQTRVPIPRGAHSNDQPARTGVAPTAIRNAIWQRLLDSLGPGGVLQRTLEWSLVLNQIPAVFGGGAAGLLNRTRPEWDRLRSRIDNGLPCPIGLIFSNTDVWFQHQILVYGYENTGPSQGTMFVYDNNSPHQFGSSGHHVVTLDLRGPALSETGLGGGSLAGFFCSNYFQSLPVGMSKAFGEFVTWTGDARTWMVTDGARMPIANPAELTALGGRAADVRPTTMSFTPQVVRPRDGALFRERSATTVFLYAGGAPFALPDNTWVDRFGGAGRVRVAPDSTLAAFAGPPDEGTLLREWSDARVWRIMGGVRRWIRTPDELNNWGGFPSVRLVPDGALAGITEGPPLPLDPVRTWQWLNMGRPERNVNIRTALGAVTVMDTPSAPQRPHVFMEGTDANLWCRYSTGTDWAWVNMGRPQSNVNISSFVGIVSVMDTTSAPQRAHLFVTGTDGNLWCRWSSGTDWHWLNMGRPQQDVDIRTALGAVTVMDTPSAPQRPHVFIEGTDANLWCRYSTGADWDWVNMGRPQSNMNISSFVGLVSVMDTTTAPQRAHLFVTGSDGNLWCRWSTGTDWRWLNMGRPQQNVNIRTALGAVTVMDTPSAPQRPHVFMEGTDANLWCRYSTGTDWAWVNMGRPQSNVNITGLIGVISVMDAPGAPQRPHLWVTGSDGNLWCRWSTGTDWHWLNMGRPDGANIRGVLTALTVMDTPTSPQRPHVFVEGSDANLWCFWWG